MAHSRSFGSAKCSSMSGVSSSTKRSICEVWMNESPNDRGTCRFTTAMTVSAHSTAASVASTEVPRET